ncbi:MAG TPA: NAD-dependent epimerase/dehydratase family protein [Roseiflexaceae bacterium]|nr:NAD-dependent epimerase/dehydratase family protein [Roseiflexaceae bacterium]
MTLRVLITGASGFAGGYLAAYAHERGAAVYGMSRGAALPPGVAGIRGDLADPADAQRAVRASAPDYVFHLAAQTPANAPGAAPQEWLTVNPLGCLHLLEAVRAHAPAARVLVVSSSAVYGHVPAAQLPIREGFALQPTTMYGVSKAAQELLAIRYAAEYGMQVVRARPFNLLGPGEPRAMLTSTLAAQVAAIARGEAPPVVTMRHRATSRDFTDIRDAVRAYWALAERGAPGAVYNVCSGVAVPIGALADRLLRLAGVSARIEETAPVPARGDIAAQCGSNEAIAGATGWRPAIGLDDSLAGLLRSFGLG